MMLNVCAFRSLFFGLLLFSLPAIAVDDAVLLRQTNEIVVEGGKLFKKTGIRIQINNKEGERFARIDIPYSKISKVSGIVARLYTGSGELVRKMSPSEITRRSAISDISLFEDDMVATFTLKHNRYPYIIEYEYEAREAEFIYLDWWMPVLDSRIPTREAELTLTVPADYPFRYVGFQVSAPDSVITGKSIRYQWKASYAGRPEKETFEAAHGQTMPWVKLVPQRFRFGKEGSNENWTSYGNWEYSLLEGLNVLPLDEQAAIGKAIDGIADRRERVKTLYHRLQDQTRYINVSIETGGMVPYPASYVAANRYGDCKALTNYFKAVLEAAGIDACYCNVYAGSPNHPVNRTLPAQQFNHAILMVPLDADTLWVDCTSKLPLGYAGTFIQNRDAFVIKNNGSHFARIPAMQPDDVREVLTTRISYPVGSSAEVVFEGLYRGKRFEYLRSLGNTVSAEDRERILRDYVVGDGFELNDFELVHAGRDSTAISLRLDTRSSQVFSRFGNETVVNNLGLWLPRMQKPANRKTPVQIDEPLYKIDTLVYKLPRMSAIKTLTGDRKVESRFGAYELRAKRGKSELRVIKRLLIRAGTYDLAEYPSFFAFIEAIRAEEAKPIMTLSNQVE